MRAKDFVGPLLALNLIGCGAAPNNVPSHMRDVSSPADDAAPDLRIKWNGKIGCANGDVESLSVTASSVPDGVVYPFTIKHDAGTDDLTTTVDPAYAQQTSQEGQLTYVKMELVSSVFVRISQDICAAHAESGRPIPSAGEFIIRLRPAQPASQYPNPRLAT